MMVEIVSATVNKITIWQCRRCNLMYTTSESAAVCAAMDDKKKAAIGADQITDVIYLSDPPR